MQDAAKFTDTLAQTAGNLLETLKASGGDATSWDLKFKLHLSSSSLYLALGWLAAQGKIALYPKELNFRVVLTETERG
ncbi:MAG: winged helix-turn-helix domain-containing protein [Elusimicrobiota bacterium]|nr:winged helix-turn-helix domain-containing protein [Elusimicrobiota bacterium]